jgi:hypothetical protein
MIAPRKPINVRTRTSRNNEIEDIKLKHPGPYMARVVSHLDKKFGGGLEVELIKTSSTPNSYENSQQTYTVNYASPFYGVTPLQQNDSNDAYSSSQQSYGFWAVPPDPGSLVLVVFIEGDVSQGFWIACIQNEYMNFMVPEPRVSTTLTTPTTPGNLTGKKLPVAEYNKFLANPNNNYPTSQPRPYNETYVDRMLEQGLLDDDVRGTTSTSSRREVPSNVYGMSTPGPVDKRPGSPTVERGVHDSKATVFSSRLGGHSIVMDDGDETILRSGPASSLPKEYIKSVIGSTTTGDVTLPANEHFRIRTRTGHQILLHNTEDLIYISNSRGTTWIELTSNGKIDIYAQDSVSVHTQQDLNVTADRDINFSAFENINISAGKELRISSGDSSSIKTGNFFTVDSGESVSFNANTFFSGFGKTSASLTGSTGDVNIVSGKSTLVKAGSDVGIAAISGSFRASAEGDMHLNANASAYLTSNGGSLHLKSSGGNIQQEASASIFSKAGASVFTQAVGGSINLKASSSIFSQSGSTFNIQSQTVAIDGSSKVFINSKKSASAAGAAGATPAGAPKNANPQVPVPVKEVLIPSRIPQHEPWLQHENLNPNSYTPENTRAGVQSADTFTQPIPDTYLRNAESTFGTTQTAAGYPGGSVPAGYRDSQAEQEDGLEQIETQNLGTPNAIKVFEYFVGKGFTEAQSAGIVGNLMIESGREISHTAVGDNGRAYGIAQWNDEWSPDRVANFASVIGTPLRSSNFDQQLEFIWWELQNESGGGKTAYAKIRALADPPDKDIGKLLAIAEESAAIFDQYFERSSGYHREDRERLAASFYLQYIADFDLDANPGIVRSAQTAIEGSTNAQVPNIPAGPVDLIDPGTGNLSMRVVENQRGARTRRLPIQEYLKNILNRAAHAAGIDQVVITSGGQPYHPSGPRTGSQRHDGGNAADLYLVVGGRKLVNTTDRARMEAFITACVKYGLRGIGHSTPYMGPSTIHVDPHGAWGSRPASLLVWGVNGRYSTREAWVDAAARRGLL